jgi:hypothetical protein
MPSEARFHVSLALNRRAFLFLLVNYPDFLDNKELSGKYSLYISKDRSFQEAWLDRKRIERIIENKYSLLLFFLTSLIVVSIVSVHNFMVYSAIVSFLSLVVYLIMLRILKAHRYVLIAYMVFAFTALLCHYLAAFVVNSTALGVTAMIVYIVMIGLIIIFMIRRIFSEKLITGDTIKGGISVYILMATWWQLVYYFLWLMNPNAFVFTIGTGHQGDFLYYSITTMTSLGFGDILPRSHPARVFSMLQAIVGQLYIAVFVARLVGLHIAGRVHHK